MNSSIIIFLKLAGILQIVLSIGSLVIPKLLNWNAELNKVAKIIGQMFWTYAGYILTINFFFGVISLFGASDLLARTFLSRSIAVLIFLYWLARILIQFFYFDTKSAPQGFIYKAGEIALVILFLYFAIVYGMVTYLNFVS